MDIRYQPGQPIRLNVLGDQPLKTTAQFQELRGRNARLLLDRSLAAGTAVRMDLEDSMLLGEISGCAPVEEGFAAVVEVREAIPSMSDLARLVAAVMNESRSEVAAPQTETQVR